MPLTNWSMKMFLLINKGSFTIEMIDLSALILASKFT